MRAQRPLVGYVAESYFIRATNSWLDFDSVQLTMTDPDWLKP
jgi:hypothetical protein